MGYVGPGAVFFELLINCFDSSRVMVQVVFFDLCGVLVSDPLDPWYASVKRSHGLERLEAYGKIRHLWKDFKQGSIDEFSFWDMVAAAVGAPPSKAAAWRLVPYAEVKVIEGVKPLIHSLIASGVKVGIISNISREWKDHIFSRVLPMAWFDPLVLSCDLGCSKPDKVMFEKALQAAGVSDPKDCLFIDNGRKNIEAAGSLGWQAVFAEDTEQIRRGLERFGLIR